MARPVGSRSVKSCEGYHSPPGEIHVAKMKLWIKGIKDKQLHMSDVLKAVPYECMEPADWLAMLQSFVSADIKLIQNVFNIEPTLGHAFDLAMRRAK